MFYLGPDYGKTTLRSLGALVDYYFTFASAASHARHWVPLLNA